MLTPGTHHIPAGMVTAVVTQLEMTARPTLRDVTAPAGLELREIPNPDPDWYRDLFRRVGAEQWLWFSRLALSDTDLNAILHDPEVQVLAIEQEGVARGLLELDFRTNDQCELVFFGLESDLIGQGVGRWLMNMAITRAWAAPICRFHVHTCTLDSPQALPFYMRSGFRAIAQKLDVSPDPRLTGVLPESAGPRVPIIQP